MGGAHGVVAGLAGELLYGAVLEDEDRRPDEVGEEASPEDDDEDGEVLPEVEAVVGEELALGDVADGFACIEAEGEKAAHNASEDGYGEAFAEGEVGLACFGLFFGGDFALFGDACGSVDGDAEETDEDAEEDDLAGGLVEDGEELAVEDGGNDGAEGGAEAEGDGVSEGDAEVADGEAEGEATGSPEDAPEDGVVDAAGVLSVGGVKDGEEVRDEDAGEEGGGDDPGGETLDEPVDLPRPALDAAEGDEVCGGGETADPVIDDADKRIRSHESSLLE